MRLRATRGSVMSSGGILLPSLDAQAAAFFAARATPKLWIDAGLSSARFQDTAAATALTTAGQTFGRINDRSGGGNDVIQATAGKRPALVQANGLSWISADGADDGLYTAAALNLSSVDRVTLIAGLRKRNSDATVMLAELGAEFTTGGGLGLYSSSASPQAYFQWGVSGASGNPTPIIASPSPTDTCVIVATAWLGATSGVSMRIERITAGGTAGQDDTSVPGARNFKSDVLNLLCRNNASLFAPFDMSSFMLIGGPALTAAELLLLKRVTAEKTGIPL